MWEGGHHHPCGPQARQSPPLLSPFSGCRLARNPLPSIPLHPPLSSLARAYRDDWGRTALHWAAFLGLTDVAQLLLLRGQQWAEREAAQDSDAPAIPPLQEFQARCGCV